MVVLYYAYLCKKNRLEPCKKSDKSNVKKIDSSFGMMTLGFRIKFVLLATELISKTFQQLSSFTFSCSFYKMSQWRQLNLS